MSTKKTVKTYTKKIGITVVFCTTVMLLLFSGCSKNKPLADAVVDRDSLPSMTSLGVTTLISDSGITRYKIVTEEWPGYELRKDIPAGELDASFGARKYSYGLYKDGTPKAMILVLDGRSLYCRKDTRLAHEACRAKGVFCMNLMMHLPNRRSYISEQLRNNVSR